MMDFKTTSEPLLSVVLPAFNEEPNVEPMSQRLLKVLSSVGHFEVIWVDDGSSDGTLEKLEALAKRDPRFRYLSFSRNFGHQMALKAGLDAARGECVVSLDADMQHPPELILQMLKKWGEGFDVIYTIRKDPKKTSLKNFTSSLFYRLFSFLTVRQVGLTAGAADFRLLDRSVVNVLKEIKETSLFLRGMIQWVGFKQFTIEYTPEKRHAGTSKYNPLKMLRLAVDGITSFSIFPLRVSIFLGLALWLSTLIYVAYAVFAHLFLGNTITGWTSLIVSVLLTSGTQLLMMGIMGEYLGKLFMESKHRPSYIIRQMSGVTPFRQEENAFLHDSFQPASLSHPHPPQKID